MENKNFKTLKRGISVVEKAVAREVEHLKSIDKERCELEIASQCIAKYIANHEDPEVFFERMLGLVVKESKAKSPLNAKKRVIEKIQAMKKLEEISKNGDEFTYKVAMFIKAVKFDIYDKYALSECAFRNIDVACGVLDYRMNTMSSSKKITENQNYYLTYKNSILKANIEDAIEYIYSCKSSINEEVGRDELADDSASDSTTYDENNF